jgi:hypothetical protein
MNIPDHDAIVRRAIELLGGKQEFFAEADRELADVNGRWKQNIEVIGRILRAHLFVEHYIGEYLAKANPRLGALNNCNNWGHNNWGQIKLYMRFLFRTARPSPSNNKQCSGGQSIVNPSP